MRFFLFSVICCNIIYGTENAQVVGFKLYQSNKWDYSLIKNHKYDHLKNGLYTITNFNLGPLNLYNSMFFTTDSLQAINGSRKSIAGGFGYTNRAFIASVFKKNKLHNRILLGREYISIGNGLYDKLFFSNNCRPLDQFLWTYNYKNIYGSSGVINLETINNKNRFISLHTLGYKNDKFSILFGEAILFASEDHIASLRYINPVSIWLAELHNNISDDGNAFLYIGLKFKEPQSFSLWFDFLVDDYQLQIGNWGEKLEPNTFGIILGFEKIGWPFKNSINNFEYTLITNRTYQAQKPEEIFMSFEQPIGHHLGNDFDMIFLSFSEKKDVGKVQPNLSIAYMRDGANGIETPFDLPWENPDNLIDGSYKESVPTTPINYISQLELSAQLKLKEEFDINLGIQYYKHSNSTDLDGLNFIFRLQYEWNKIFKY